MRKFLASLLTSAAIFLACVSLSSLGCSGSGPHEPSPTPNPTIVVPPTEPPPPATPVPAASVCKQRNSLNISIFYCLEGDGSTNKETPCPSDMSQVPNCAVPTVRKPAPR